jgi:hypothetical protein
LPLVGYNERYLGNVIAFAKARECVGRGSSERIDMTQKEDAQIMAAFETREDWFKTAYVLNTGDELYQEAETCILDDCERLDLAA